MNNPTDNILGAKGNILIEAAAGTGKTYNLTEKVMHLMRNGTGIAQILAVTFTELAAAQMREKIYERLSEEITREKNDDIRAFLLKQKQEFHRNRISTIHGFCYRMLSHYPDEVAAFGANIQPESLPEHEGTPKTTAAADGSAGIIGNYDAVLLEQELRRVFYQMYRNLPPLVRQLDRLGKYNFEDFLARLNRFPSSYLEPVAKLSRQEYDEMMNVHVQDLQNDLENALEKFSKIVNQNLHWFKKIPVFTGSPVEFVETIFTKNMTPRLRGAINDEFIPDVEIHLTDPGKTIVDCNSLLSLFTPEREYYAFENLSDLAELALRWQSLLQYNRFKKRRISFDDIIMLTHRLVTKHPEVAADIRQHFDFILVDEFQDTDRLQWDIIRCISKAGNEGNLLLVGDMKQAIYEFRGGNVAIFNEAKLRLEEFEKAGASLLKQPLQSSFRSNNAIIKFTNAFFRFCFDKEPLDRKSFEAYPQDLNLPDDAGLGNRGAGQVKIFKFRSADAALQHKAHEIDIPIGNADANAEIEAKWLASFIREIQDGKHPQYADITNRMKQNEIAIGILFRSRSRQWMIEKALDMAEVPFKSLTGNGFYKRQEIRDIYFLLRFFMDAYDNLALTAVLRSPLGGVSDAGLLAIRLSAGLVRRLEKDNQERDIPFWKIIENPDALSARLIPPDAAMLKTRIPLLAKWREMVKTERISDLLEEILSKSDFYSGFSDQETTRLNVWKLLDVIRELESTGNGSLMEITQFLGYQLAEGVNEKEADVPESGSVQLLTIHGSKGLEYPMVILPQLHGGQGNRGKDLCTRPLDEINPENKEYPLMAYKIVDKDGDSVEGDTLLGCILKEKIKERTLAETKRLFYVAQTRAKSHLILFDSRKKEHDGNSETTFSDLLNQWPLYSGDELPESDLFTEETLTADVLARLFSATAKSVAVSEKKITILNRTDDLNRALESAKAGTSIASDEEKPVFKEEDETLSTGQWDEIKANDAGTLIHMALEFPDLFQLNNQDQKNVLLAQALRLGISGNPESDLDRILQQASSALNILQTTFHDARQWLHEVAFDVKMEKGTVRGVIDLLIQDSQGRWHLIDFKSGNISAHYKKQLQIYREATRRVSDIDIPPENCKLLLTGENPPRFVTIDEL